ncbi:hypothetical protein [Marinobacter sp. JSM 1782161]|uniref:hypothetical protein n=1 Tax=Marinobacter sp. JSM 1782161 TaxID=2685906 RepID=UPI001402058A|nr:hypothetical protein [Marinobacter sp. JSM 1782161]
MITIIVAFMMNEIIHSVTEVDSLQQWQSLIVAGNTAFERADYETAATRYRAACERALELLAEWHDADAVTAALCVSYQNLADTYLDQCRVRDALETYRRLHEVLELAYRNGNANRRKAALSASRRTVTDLMCIIQSHTLNSDYAKEILKDVTAFPRSLVN